MILELGVHSPWVTGFGFQSAAVLVSVASVVSYSMEVFQLQCPEAFSASMSLGILSYPCSILGYFNTAWELKCGSPE